MKFYQIFVHRPPGYLCWSSPYFCRGSPLYFYRLLPLYSVGLHPIILTLILIIMPKPSQSEMPHHISLIHEKYGPRQKSIERHDAFCKGPQPMNWCLQPMNWCIGPWIDAISPWIDVVSPWIDAVSPWIDASAHELMQLAHELMQSAHELM